MPLGWYVARTRPMAEYVARDHLEAKGFEHFLPVVSTSSPRRGREDAPLFPGYLFVRHDLASAWSISLRTTPGLKGLVAFDGVAPPVPDDVIEGLHWKVAEINGVGGLHPQFRPGDRVWVRLGSGETEDLAEVIAEARSPQDRVRVLMRFLGRLAHAEVSRTNIRLAREYEASTENLARPGLIEALPEGTRRWSLRGTRGRGRHFRGGGSDNDAL